MRRASSVLVCLATIAIAGCNSGSNDTPTAPPPSNAPPSTPTPAPATYNIAIDVRSMGPSSVPLDGSTIEILDGMLAGQTFTTDADGELQLAGVEGNMNIEARAPGFQNQRRGVGPPTPPATLRLLSFHLPPVRRTVTSVFTGTISGGGFSTCPTEFTIYTVCRGFEVVVHNSGTITARLVWGDDDNDLDLAIYEGSTQLAISQDVVTTSEQVSTTHTAGFIGTRYQVRVYWYAGESVENFTLTVTHPS